MSNGQSLRLVIPTTKQKYFKGEIFIWVHSLFIYGLRKQRVTTPVQPVGFIRV